MNVCRHITPLLAGLLCFSQSWAQGWTGSMESGGVVHMDPRTNKATIYSESGSTQLWDGTHRMQDGSVIIVQDGVVTSGPNLRQPPVLPDQPLEEPGAVLASSACVELVIKVCGFNGECRDTTPCSPARQLMQLEKDESWQTGSQGPNQTSAQCRQALDNEAYFSRCNVKRPSQIPTACEALSNSVCGEQNQCADSEACSAANQLLSMETQERLASRRPERTTFTSGKCDELTRGSEFFIRCPTAATGPGPVGRADSDNEKPLSERPPAAPPSEAPAHQ